MLPAHVMIGVFFVASQQIFFGIILLQIDKRWVFVARFGQQIKAIYRFVFVIQPSRVPSDPFGPHCVYHPEPIPNFEAAFGKTNGA